MRVIEVSKITKVDSIGVSDWVLVKKKYTIPGAMITFSHGDATKVKSKQFGSQTICPRY